MRQSVWERFAHLSRFELGLDLMHSNFCHLFQFCSINEAIPIPIRKRFSPLINLPGTNLSNILKASLNSAELSWCSAWRQMFTLCNLQDVHLLPHHLHELVKVEFPVSVDVVLNDKAQHLPIDLRQVGSENADRLPTPIMGNYDYPPITS